MSEKQASSSTITPGTHRTRAPAGATAELRSARTCYDHLAGALGVHLTEALEQRGLLAARGERSYDLTSRGEAFLKREWQIDAAPLRGPGRSFARRCLDGTERRDHLAGALGRALYQRFLELRWLRHDPESRAVYLSAEGRRKLEPWLGPSKDV